MEIHSDYITSGLPLSEEYVIEYLDQVLNSWKWVTTCYGAPYDSIMDMVFCNTFPHRKRDCKRFYDGKGKSFIELYEKWDMRAKDMELRDSLRRLVRGSR